MKRDKGRQAETISPGAPQRETRDPAEATHMKGDKGRHAETSKKP